MLATYKTDEDIKRLYELIPHADKMQKLLIEAEDKIDSTLVAG